MSRGFNTNVRVGDRLFHVQTEDRGPAHAKIDTAVYLEGRVIHRHSAPYAQLDGPSSEQVEEQHRGVIEGLRAGIAFDGMGAGAAHKPPAANLAGGIAVRLLNAKTWMSRGQADLQVEVSERGDAAAPVAGARVEARLDGVEPPQIYAAETDLTGRAHIKFPLPSAGIAGATLVIRAIDAAGEGEIRFNLRAKSKTPAREQ
ncbi:MAG: hypothetical protein WA734_11205 [Candidatus Acidiferrales bacterium]